jgi:hypothetical protein
MGEGGKEEEESQFFDPLVREPTGPINIALGVYKF